MARSGCWAVHLQTREVKRSRFMTAHVKRLQFYCAQPVRVGIHPRRFLPGKALTNCDLRPVRARMAPGIRAISISSVPRSKSMKRLLTRRPGLMIGAGVLVGVYKPSDPRKYFLPRVGVACPVTAILDFRPSGTAAAGTRNVALKLHDPTRRSAVRLAGAQRPLAAHFAAPFAYYPNPRLLLARSAMMHPRNYEQRTGLYMLEPYDPDRIPVIFVHGLFSILQMWVPTVTAVESDPVLRAQYQFWVFAYPTGDPIVLSSLRLRESLAQVYQRYPKTKDVVLISHSMGGLLSQMQAETTPRVRLDRVFRSYADRLYTALPPDNVVKRALIFDANPRRARIVFIF